MEAGPVEKADEGIVHTGVGPGQSCLRTNLSKVLMMREVRQTDLLPGSPGNAQCSPELGHLHQTQQQQLHKRVTSVEDMIQLIFSSTQVWIDVTVADVSTILIR